MVKSATLMCCYNQTYRIVINLSKLDLFELGFWEGWGGHTIYRSDTGIKMSKYFFQPSKQQEIAERSHSANNGPLKWLTIESKEDFKTVLLT